jgi:nucleotidyltransferase/DNA polymerase involved in DNA repair
MIAHIDADAFFAAVLQRKHPHLRGKPLLALGMGGGCVIAASYEAKAKGVKTGMPLKEAIRLAPDALQIHSDFRETGLASQQIEAILEDICPIIEKMSIDEWFLDVSTLPGGLPQDLLSWTKDMQARVGKFTGISVSVGVAPSKLLAKMSSEYRKPAGCTVVYRAGTGVPQRPHHHAQALDIENFLRDRPAAAIPGIGRRRQVHTQAHNWETAWDIANAPDTLLLRLFGSPGTDMKRELNGERVHDVVGEAALPKSVSRCRSFKALADRELIWAHILQHLTRTVLRMRRHELACLGISVWLRDKRYEHMTTHAKLPQPLDTEETLTPYVRKCFLSLLAHGGSFTQAGLALWNLRPRGAQQFSLFEEPEHAIDGDALQHSLDTLRDRFGRNIISRGASIAVTSQDRPELGFAMIEGN